MDARCGSDFDGHSRHVRADNGGTLCRLDGSDRAYSITMVQILAEDRQPAVAQQTKRVRHELPPPQRRQPPYGWPLTPRPYQLLDRLGDDGRVPLSLLNPRAQPATADIPHHSDRKPRHAFVARCGVDCCAAT